MGAQTFDVVVIGGGLAGAVAAKKAAEQGKRVALARATAGATVHASGAFDLCGDADPFRRSVEGAPPPLVEALRVLLRRNPFHPYAVISGGEPEGVLAILDDAQGDLFRELDEEGLLYRGSLSRNLWLATPGGRVKESAFAQDAIAAGDLASLAKARLAVVALGEGAAARARGQAETLRRSLDRLGFFGVKEIVPCAVEALPPGAGRAPDEVTIASALDREEAAAEFAREVGRAIGAAAPRATHVLFPPVLGMRQPGIAVATLARETGRDILETVGTPPSVPGQRLALALDRVLARRNVKVFRGRAFEARAASANVRSVRVASPQGGEPEVLEARSFVLAGGKFLGGGLREGNRAGEPLFGLPLHFRGRPVEELALQDWFDARVTGAHPGMEVGVRTDSDLRPLDRSGEPVFENLFAAGSILAGASFVADRAGLGVALATGYLAGMNAAEAH